jgi:hypothetical protein
MENSLEFTTMMDNIKNSLQRMDNKQFETLKNQKMWIFMSMSM